MGSIYITRALVYDFLKAHWLETIFPLNLITMSLLSERLDVALLALVGVPIVTAPFVRKRWNEWLCETRGRATDALITDFETPKGPNARHGFLEIEYTAHAFLALPHVARIKVDNIPGMGMLVGKILAIKYLPEKPELVVPVDLDSFLEAHHLDLRNWLDEHK